MDIGRILSRSIEIGWRYRVLWALAFIFALFGGGGSYSPGNTFNYQFSGREVPNFNVSPAFEQTIGAIVIGALCFALIWFLVSLYFRFVARGALVSAVRSIESGNAPTFGGAWREGGKYWGRLLGLGFLVNVPLTILSLLVIGVTLLPFFGTLSALINESIQGNQPSESQIAALISGVLGFIVLFCCAIACLAVIGLIIHPIYQFAVRAIVLEDLGVTAGLGRGYERLRTNLGSVSLLYLALIGCRILFGIVVFVIAIPLTMVIGAVTASAAAQQSVPTVAVLALCLTIPVALIMLLLETIFQVFEQNVWTEGYLALLGNPPVMPTAPVPPAPIVPPPTFDQPPAPTGQV